jgi:hypothetical protein
MSESLHQILQIFSHSIEAILGISKTIEVLQLTFINKDGRKDKFRLNLDYNEYNVGIEKLWRKISTNKGLPLPDVIVPLSCYQPTIIASKMLEFANEVIPLQPCLRDNSTIGIKEYAGYTSCSSDNLALFDVNIYVQNSLLLLPRDTRILLIDSYALRSASAYTVKSFLKQHGFDNITYGVLVLLDSASDDPNLIEVDFNGLEAKESSVRFTK